MNLLDPLSLIFHMRGGGHYGKGEVDLLTCSLAEVADELMTNDGEPVIQPRPKIT